MVPQDGLLLNTTDAARHLNLSKSTLAKMRIIGNGPRYSKLGRRVLYRIEDLNTWIMSNQRRSTSEIPNMKGDF